MEKTPAVSDRISEYLADLPAGLESYPGYVGKMSVVRAFTSGLDVEALQALVPPVFDVREFVSRPVSVWASEVRATVVYLASRDAFFESDDAFVEDALARNRKILASPLYKMVGFMLTQGRMSKLSARALSTMHRGIKLIGPKTGGDDDDKSRQTWELHAAPFLVPRLIGRCYATALVAAAELAGGTSARVVVESSSSTVTIVTLRSASVAPDSSAG